MDLPYPSGHSINDGIPKKILCSLSYITVDSAITAIQKLGIGTILAKVYVKSTFAFCSPFG